MNIYRKIMTVGLSIVAMLAVTSAASAAQPVNHWAHLSDLSRSIENNARELRSEVKEHYRHAHDYGHLLSDARTIRNLARDIRYLARGERHILTIESKQIAMDKDFNHIHDMFHHAEEDRTHGEHGVHGETSHIHRLLGSIKSQLTELREEVGLLKAIKRVHGHDRHYVERRPIPYLQPRTIVDVQGRRFGVHVNTGRNLYPTPTLAVPHGDHVDVYHNGHVDIVHPKPVVVPHGNHLDVHHNGHVDIVRPVPVYRAPIYRGHRGHGSVNVGRFHFSF